MAVTKMKISQRGIDFIKSKEKFEPKEYPCPGGKLTIGYGHAILEGEKFPSEITKEKAEKLLTLDINDAERIINRYVKVDLTQGQYDALVSLVFNWGGSKFIKSKGLKKLNNGDYDGAAKEFEQVIRVKGKILDGLVIRRKEEKEMWNEIVSNIELTTGTNNKAFGINESYKDKTLVKQDHFQLKINKPRTLLTTEEVINNIADLHQDVAKEKEKRDLKIFLIVAAVIIIILSFVLYSTVSAKPLEGEYSTCFTPPEQCGDLIVDHIKSAKSTIFVQAYVFTSKKIIEALIEAQRRGVEIELILDRSNLGKAHENKLKMLSEAGITIYKDKAPGIAHNKVMIIDYTTVITGSFNFTKNADTMNAENIIIIKNKEVAKDYLKNWNDRDKELIK